MKKLAIAILLAPSLALAHPGHDDVGIGGTPAAHATITNPVIVLLLIVALTLAVRGVARMVRS
jgi:hypothetical protein